MAYAFAQSNGCPLNFTLTKGDSKKHLRARAAANSIPEAKLSGILRFAGTNVVGTGSFIGN